MTQAQQVASAEHRKLQMDPQSDTHLPMPGTKMHEKPTYRIQHANSHQVGMLQGGSASTGVTASHGEP